MADIPPIARALGRIPSGLFILTTGEGDACTGSLVSLVQQVGFAPPAIAVAIQQGRHIESVVRDSGSFCVSVITESSKSLLGHFAKGFGPDQPVLKGLDTATSDVGVLYPAIAQAHLACKVIGETTWTDHVLFCGEVVGGSGDDEEKPLIHVRKNGMQY